MATVVAAAVSVQSGTDNTTYSTGSFTPAANDLIVVFAGVNGSTSSDWLVTDSLGGTYTKIARALYVASADITEVWVGTALAAASARTVTYAHASGLATGGFIQPLQVSGMTRVNSSAVRSFGTQDNQAAASTPAPVLSATALTSNPVITSVSSSTNPPAITVPSGFTSRFNLGHTAPVRGMITASDDSGFTSATVTWGGTSATAFGSIAIELDTTSPPAAAEVPPLVNARR